MPSFRQVLEGVDQAWRGSAPRSRRASGWSSGLVDQSRIAAPRRRPATDRGLFEAAARDRGLVRLGQRRLGPRAQVPATDDDRVPAPPASPPGDPRPARSSAFRSTRWPTAACATSSAAASIATRPTRAGWSRTSSRCSTTTPSSRGSTCTPGRLSARSARPLPRGRDRDARLHDPRADDRRRRLRREPGRRHRRHRGPRRSPGARPRSARCWATVGGSPLRDGLRRHRRGQLGGRDDPVAGRPADDEPPFRDDAALEAGLAAARARLLARRAERPQPARDDKALAAWNGLAIAALADAGRCWARSATRPRRAGRPTTDRRRAARPPTVAPPVVEGWPGGRERRARGLHAPCRRAAGAVRGHVRRALVLDRARPDGPRPGPVRRSGRRLLRHRRRPRTAGDPTQGRAGQRGPVGGRDGDDRAAAARGLDRRGRATGTPPNGRSARSCRSSPLPDRVRASGSARVVRAVEPSSRWPSSATRRTPATAGLLARVCVRLAAEPGPRRAPADRGGHVRSRCCPTASPSMAGRRPTSAAPSRAGCRSPMRRRSGGQLGRGPRT